MNTPPTANGRGRGKQAVGWIVPGVLTPILVWAVRSCLLNQALQGNVDPPPPVSASFTVPFEGDLLRWSEDSQRLLVVGKVRSADQGRFTQYAIIDSANGRILHRGEMPHEISGAVWSPDSRRVALCSSRDAAKDAPDAPPAEVQVIDTETFTTRHFPTTKHQPGRGFHGLRWTPNGQSLFVEESTARSEPVTDENSTYDKYTYSDLQPRCWRSDWTETECPWPALPTANSVRLISPDNSVMVVWVIRMTGQSPRGDSVQIYGPDGTVCEFPDFENGVRAFSVDGTAIAVDRLDEDPIEWRSVVDFSVQAPAKPAYSGSSRAGDHDANFRLNLSGHFSFRGTELQLIDLNTKRKKRWQSGNSSGSFVDIMLGRGTISPDGERVAYLTAASHITIWFVGNDWVNQ